MTDLNDYKMTEASGIGVYCGTYKKYNEGSLFGMWIDLEKIYDTDEFFEVCRELHKDEDDPEFMFQDYQGFPESMYHESMNEDDVARILEYVQMTDDEREMYDDFVECYGETDKDIRDIQDRCVGGGFDSLHEFSDQQAEDMLDGFEAACKRDYSCKGAAGMIDTLRKYFNYDAFYCDIKSEYSIGSNGNVFYDE